MNAVRAWIAWWDETGFEATIHGERIPLRSRLAHWLCRFEWTWDES